MNHTDLVMDKTYGLSEIGAIAEELAGLCKDKAVLAFVGSLGAGKTTLIQALLRLWGVKGPIQSPTFSYVNSYRLPVGAVHHFDLYRLSSAAEFVEAGFHEYLYRPGSISLIEWPEIILPLLAAGACHVQLDYVDRETRSIRVWRD